jgi:hypothetical protein
MFSRALIAILTLSALGACAPNDNIYGEPDTEILRCNALPEPGERAACIDRLGREAHARRDNPRTGPPSCHPASTTPREHDADRC